MEHIRIFFRSAFELKGLVNIIHKHMRLYIYKILLRQEIKAVSWPNTVLCSLCVLMHNKIDSRQVLITSHFTFHIDGRVNCQSNVICRNEQLNLIHS